jgi:hypothetical protein
MPRNVVIVLFTYIIISNDTIQLQISSIKHYGTDMFTLFCTSLWEDSHQGKVELNSEVMVIIIIIIIISITAIPSQVQAKKKTLRKAGDWNLPPLIC